MKVRQLDENHDWQFGRGLASYIDGSEAVRQCVQTILLSFRFNWFLDEDHGINWFAYFVKNPDVPVMENDIKRNILEVEGVQTLQELDLQLNTITRQLIITVRYTDIYNSTQTVVSSVTNP